LRAISCQAEKPTKRKDAHRKPLLPDLRVAEVSGSLFIFYHILLDVRQIAWYFTNYLLLFII
jgi:hypothetical protein